MTIASRLFISFCLLVLTQTWVNQAQAQATGDWPMAGATLGRTSNSGANVSAVSGITWYRPIEAYISSSTQLITSNGKVYVATSKGLVVLDADTGSLVCRLDTELPVSAPTVDGNTVYVPGWDRKLYSLNASTCAVNWTFTGADAGFSANPLVTGGRVYIGNRDGKFYAINTSNGSQAWSFTTGGPIMQSAAYDNGILYFASMDMHGYALNASNGSQVWKTPQKLPGEQYSTWWPVVHGNYIVWSAATGYENGASPGGSDAGPNETDFNAFFGTVTGTVSAGTVVSSSDGSHDWPAGSAVMSTTTSGGAAHTLQGWADAYPARRVYALVNKSNGIEPFRLPLLESGQNESGQMHPPVSDGTNLYFNGPYQRSAGNIPRSTVFAWKEGTNWLRRMNPLSFAADEPLILSMANGQIFANLCCDREARRISPVSGSFWNYGPSQMLDDILPSSGEPNSYDPMWAFYDGEAFLERLGGYYKGNITSRNGVYNHHSMQNPLVPHRFTNGSGQQLERLFTHRSNAIIALGPNSNKASLPLVTINPNPSNTADTLTGSELQYRLETEVSKMVNLYLTHGNNGFLRPAYINDGSRAAAPAMPEDNNYFVLPADTLYSLSIAYPHLSAGLKTNLLNYLSAYWQKYFVSSRILKIGWNSGQPRETMEYPPEVANRMSQIGDSTNGTASGTWQRTFYAAWKYAQLVPSQAASIYNTVRPILSYPPPALDVVRNPAMYNDYIIGYQGFLNLYDLAGTNPDPNLRAGVTTQLNNLINTRLTNFAKDHPWQGDVDNPGGLTINNYSRRFNCTRNFLYMTPDLGNVMRGSAQFSTINTALNEYLYVCPNWFMARDHNTFQEGSAHHIFDSHALFQAKAHIARESQANLSKWIDVPWTTGDLYYIQNVVAALNTDPNYTPAPTPTTGTATNTPQPTNAPDPGDADGDTDVDLQDYNIILSNFGRTGNIPRNQGDLNASGSVDLQDYNQVVSNFGN